MVVLTGDMVDRDPGLARLYAGPAERHLRGVPHGAFCVLGNHDHFTDPGLIARNIAAAGIRVLRDERVRIPGLPLSLTGLDDQGAVGHSFSRGRAGGGYVDGQLSFGSLGGPGPREGDFRILLNHRPDGFRQAMGEGYGLYLVGHTHGGQYAVPGFPEANLAHLFYKYTSGLYKEHGGYLNVSCGLASVGIPFRFGPWPEFSILTLERA
jgi:predicted MPP superfamily phosphohydrolase